MNSPFFYTLAGILLSYFLKKMGFLTEDDSAPLSRIVMNVTFPAAIFLNMSAIELSPDLLLLPLFPIVMGALVIAVGPKVFRSLPESRKGLMISGSMGLNIGLFAFPIIEALFGAEGLRVAAMMDVGNAFTIFGLSYMTASRYSPLNKGEKRGFLKTVKIFIKSPPLMTYFIAVVINLSGLIIPTAIRDGLNIAGRANYFLILTVLGLVLNFDWIHLFKSGVIKLMLFRYSAALVFSLFLWHLLPFDPLTRKVSVICLFLPIGFTVIPYSIEFGYDEEIAGGITNFSLFIGFFLMWGLVLLL
jgi:malate permease and related proteins